MRLWLSHDQATHALGQALAATLPGHGVVFLHGELGAGKSTLARAMLRALGVEGAIRSPTYTLVERYVLADNGQTAREALHLDLYRIAEAAELEFLGLGDRETALWLVEWPEHGGQALPAPDLRIRLEIEGAGRTAVLEPGSAIGEGWLAQLSAHGSLQSFPESSP